MKTTIDETTKTEVVIRLIADEKDLAPVVRSVYNHLREHVTAKGFRPGKAPNEIIEKELGTERVHAEIVESAADKLYRQALAEHKIRPLSAPKIELKKFVPHTELELTATVEVVPAIKLADYKKLKKTMPKIEVTDKEIESVVTSLRTRLATKKSVKRAIKQDDEAVFDFKGTQNGKPIAGGSAEKFPLLIGSGRFIPGFEEALIGLKPGDEKTFDVTFPKGYSEGSLAGKKATFSVKVHEVNEMSLPKADDKFAQEAGPFKTLAELKEDIKKQITAEKEQQHRRDLQIQIVNEVVDKSKLDIPPRLLEEERARLQSEFDNNLQKQGLKLEDYLKQQGQTQKDFEAEFEDEAQRRVKSALVLTEVAHQEGLEVGPDELEVRLQLVAGQYQDPTIQAELQKPAVRRDIANQILAEKTVAKLVEYATGA